VKTQAKNKTELRSTRDAFGEALVELGIENKDIVVVSADLAESTRIQLFAEKFPERFIEVGVAEQNMTSVAVGLALAGKIPAIVSFASFSPGKNWEQIKLGVCYNNVNVKIISTHAGVSAGPDGATHQSLEDIALMRVLPNMTIFSPIDYVETKKTVRKAFEIEGPVYVRLARPKTPMITSADGEFKIGNVNVLENGNVIALVGTGPILSEGLEAAKEINEKYPESVKVLNVPTIKPLDIGDLMKKLVDIEYVFTLEDHQIVGGLGSLICEVLAENHIGKERKVKRIGMKDCFGESGTYENLKKKYKMDKESIKKLLLEALKK